MSASSPIQVKQPAYTLMVQLVADEVQGEAYGGDNAATRSFTRADVPVANAGVGQTGLLGDLVQLSGVLSSNANAFSWRILSAPFGSVVELNGADTVFPSFVPDAGGVYEVELIVSGGGFTSEPDTMRVTVDLPWYDVVFDVGEHGSRSGGGILSQSVEWGSGAVAPEIQPNPGWTFFEWSTEFEPVYSALSVTALYQQVMKTVHVESAHGIASPPNGGHPVSWGSNMLCSVSSPDMQGATQYVCSGWIGTGSVPPEGSTTNVSFTLTNDSSIVWNWSTNYWLEDETNGAGIVSGGDVWLEKGTDALLTATAEDGWRFDRWVLDGQPVDGTTNVLSVQMNDAHAAIARFVVLDLPEAVDNHDLVWSTGGGTNWFATTEMSHDGIDVARSGVISTREDTWLATTVINSGTLSFWWRVSSEEGCDEFSWYLDEELQDVISGETGTWEQVVCRIDGDGAHLLKWEYSKDKSFSYGEDCAWLDEVVWLADKWLDTEVVGAGSVDVGDGWYIHGSNAVILASADENYHFAGWSGDLSGCASNGLEIIAPMLQDRQITARFEPNQYRVMFDAQGGGSPVPAETSVRYQQAYGSLAEVSRTGYTFDGWWTIASGGDQVSTGSVVSATGDHTLYAHWVANPYAIGMDGQGGVLSTNELEVLFDSPYGALPSASRTGYGFSGWWTAPDGVGSSIDVTTVMTTASNHTLYANWTAEEYRVSYDAVGGAVSPSSEMVTYDAQYGGLPVPARIGYAFNGWWTGTDGAGSQVTAISRVSVASNHVLFANWNVNSYEVTFDANGGPVTPISAMVIFDAPYGTLPVPVRDGHAFAGWWDDVEGAGVQVNDAMLVSTATNHSLYAAWQINSHSLDVTSGYGLPSPSIGTHPYDWGTSVTCSIVSPDTQETTRYVCSGWTGTGSVPSEGDTTNVTFTITNASAIVWDWNTEYLLDTEVAGNGSVDLPDSWLADGTSIVVHALANGGNRFDRWMLNGMPVGGNTNSIEVSMDRANQLTAHFVVLDLPEALDNHDLVWIQGGDAVWNPQIAETHDGIDAAKSGQITHNQTTWIETTVSGAGTISFWWSVSCEDAYEDEVYDRLRLFVNETEQLYICGEAEWRLVRLDLLGDGPHVLRWEYYKDKSDTFGQDCGWVDQVVWTPDDMGVIDVDNDGLPDTWEDLHGGDLDPTALCPNGINTVREAYIAGLNPTNATSRLSLNLASGNALHWSAISGRVYSIWWTTNLLENFQPLETNLLWPQGGYTNPSPSPTDYYKIKVELE